MMEWSILIKKCVVFSITTTENIKFWLKKEIVINGGKYEGQEGLDKVITEIREFEKKYSRMPKTKDKNMPRIQRVVLKGVWNDFGIRTWKNLLNKAFEAT